MDCTDIKCVISGTNVELEAIRAYIRNNDGFPMSKQYERLNNLIPLCENIMKNMREDFETTEDDFKDVMDMYWKLVKQKLEINKVKVLRAAQNFKSLETKNSFPSSYYNSNFHMSYLPQPNKSPNFNHRTPMIYYDSTIESLNDFKNNSSGSQSPMPHASETDMSQYVKKHKARQVITDDSSDGSVEYSEKNSNDLKRKLRSDSIEKSRKRMN